MPRNPRSFTRSKAIEDTYGFACEGARVAQVRELSMLLSDRYPPHAPTSPRNTESSATIAFGGWDSIAASPRNISKSRMSRSKCTRQGLRQFLCGRAGIRQFGLSATGIYNCTWRNAEGACRQTRPGWARLRRQGNRIGTSASTTSSGRSSRRRTRRQLFHLADRMRSSAPANFRILFSPWWRPTI